MAIAYVQNVAVMNHSAGTTSASLTPTAGNLLVVFAYAANGAVSMSIADTAGNTWTLIPTPAFPQVDGSGDRWCIWYAKNCLGGSSTTVTVTLGNPESTDLIFAEYSGADTSAPFDTGAIAMTQGGGFGPGATYSSGNFTTAVANELIMCFSTMYTNQSCNAGSGFTERFNGSSSSSGEELCDKIAGAAGTYDGECIGANYAGGVVMAVAFKPASAPTAKLRRLASLSGLGSGGPFFQDPLSLCLPA